MLKKMKRDLSQAFPTATNEDLVRRTLSSVYATIESKYPLCDKSSPISISVKKQTSKMLKRFYGETDPLGKETMAVNAFHGEFLSDIAVKLYFKKFQQSEQYNSVHDVAQIVMKEVRQELLKCEDAQKRIGDVSVIDCGRLLFRTREFAQKKKQSLSINDVKFLYEDDSIAVTSKAYGVLSVDGKDPNEKSIFELIRRQYHDVRIVHRLDCETSGIMIVALTKAASQHLSAQFRQRIVEKMYTAVCLGRFKDNKGIVNLPLAADFETKLHQKVDHENGKIAETHWEVIDEMIFDGNVCTKVQLKPISGRTHQLRVHMAEIGHPMLGDLLYGCNRNRLLSDRLLLHATTLSVLHPVTNRRMEFVSSCPF